MHARHAALLFALAGACAMRPEAPPEPAPSPAAAPAVSPAEQPAASPGGEEAEATFDRHCGGCHRSDRDTAKPAALAIFDLTREGWLAALTEVQIQAALGRVQGMSGATDGERQAAASALEMELARRQGGAPGG